MTRYLLNPFATVFNQRITAMKGYQAKMKTAKYGKTRKRKPEKTAAYEPF